MARSRALTSGERERRLQAAYDRIPAMRNCKGLCHTSCGPIVMTPYEAAKIDHPNDMASDPCPKLSPMGLCTVYEDRPLVCRLWGAIEAMPCVYGCMPEGGYLSLQEILEIRAEVEAVGGPVPYSSPEVGRRAIQMMMRGDL
jgi:Fe-S-cluster containining protein